MASALTPLRRGLIRGLRVTTFDMDMKEKQDGLMGELLDQR
jgi:hypothetical protein